MAVSEDNQKSSILNSLKFSQNLLSTKKSPNICPKKMRQSPLLPTSNQGRSKSLPKVRAGHLHIPPAAPSGQPIPSFLKQHSCYRNRQLQQNNNGNYREKERERALDGRGDMAHRSLKQCRQRQSKSHNNHNGGVGNASVERTTAAPNGVNSANGTGGKSNGGGGNGNAGRKPIPIDERPPFNLDTRIEGEDEVDEATGKYVRRRDRTGTHKAHQCIAHSHSSASSMTPLGGNQQFGGSGTANAIGGGDVTAHWANSLREPFHRIVRL